VSKGVLELGFGGTQYGALAASGVVGMIPFTAWLATLMVPTLDAHHHGNVIGNIVGGALAVALLFAPPIVPCIVLRARQPKGARIEWDDEGIVEWDGDFRKTTIPWSRLAGDAVVWEVQASRYSKRAVCALALRDTQTDARIHVWEERPKGSPLVRRQLCAENVEALRKEIGERGVVLGDAPDWTRAIDPARPRRTAIVWIGRLGYFFVVASLIGLRPGPLTTTIGSIAAALLAVRAVPVILELRATARREERAAHASPEASPYREGGAPPPEIDVAALDAALARRRRAAMVEAFVRIAFVVMTIAALVQA
jgi:hypothetical protein